MKKLSSHCIKENGIFSNQVKRLNEIFHKIPNKQREKQVFEIAKEFSDYKDFMLEGHKKQVQFNRIFVIIDDTKRRENIINQIE